MHMTLRHLKSVFCKRNCRNAWKHMQLSKIMVKILKLTKYVLKLALEYDMEISFQNALTFSLPPVL